MKILAIDPGCNTGWAATHYNFHLYNSGTKVFKKKKGHHPGKRFYDFEKWFRGALRTYKPDLAVYESSVNARGSEAVQATFINIMNKVCYEKEKKIAPLHWSAVKKFCTGVAVADKVRMAEAAQKIFPDINIVDDNHADALCILHYAINQYGTN